MFRVGQKLSQNFHPEPIWDPLGDHAPEPGPQTAAPGPANPTSG